MVDFTGVDIPFSANELLLSGAGLLGLVGGFIILAMAFRMAPKLIGLIFGAFKGGNKS